MTSSSASLQVGNIEFKENHQGDYVEGTMTPGINKPNPQPQPNPDPDKPNPDKPNGDVEYGDYENNMMRGVRSAMTTSMLFGVIQHLICSLEQVNYVTVNKMVFGLEHTAVKLNMILIK